MLSKHDFPGKKLFNEVIIISLMFSGAVTIIANYLTLSWLGFIDSYWAIIVSAWAQTLGLYLMKKFIDSMVHDSMVEAARIDGAGELTIFARIVMPIVKPAWLTLIIINFQVMCRHTGDIVFIFSQSKIVETMGTSGMTGE